jgi:uncharacterized protein YecT (DUF1311 family)
MEQGQRKELAGLGPPRAAEAALFSTDVAAVAGAAGCRIMRGLTLAALALVLSVVEPRATLQTQTDMNEAAKVEYTGADAELNRVYRQILEARRADAEFVVSFRAAQRAWIVFRDAHVQALYPALDKRRAYGSVYPLCRWQALAALTLERTNQLKAWTDPPAEGDTCAGSRTP